MLRARTNGITPFPATTSIPFAVFVGREIRGETKGRSESANWPPCPSFRVSHDPDSEGTSREGRDLIRSITRSPRFVRVSSGRWSMNFIQLCGYILGLITLFNFNLINSIRRALSCERRRWNARARNEEAWCIPRGQCNVNSSGRFRWTILENGSEGFSFHGPAQGSYARWAPYSRGRRLSIVLRSIRDRRTHGSFVVFLSFARNSFTSRQKDILIPVTFNNFTWEKIVNA